MPTMKLTQLAVDRIGKPAEGRIEYFDSYLPGFGVRVADTGHKSWVVMYRSSGKLRRYTLGTLGEYPKVDDARDRARRIMQEAARGIDPAAVKKAARLAKPAPRAEREPETVCFVAALFVERYCKPNTRSWQETQRRLRNHVVSRWGDRELASISRRDVLELLDNLIDRGNPIAANRVLAAVRKMFAWAVERDIISASPVQNIKAPGKETERERVLSDDELVSVWRAADAMGGTAGAFIKTLALTGQRRDEVATMRWVDLDLGRAIWTLPREANKSDRSHEVPLAPLVLDILQSLPRIGECAFTTTGDRPISGYSKIKARVDGIAQVEAWRFHDLRRTTGTGMARLGVPVSTISRVLNHREGGVTKIYNRYGYLDEKRKALEAWAVHIDRLLNPPTANVVTLRQEMVP
jgi:integrase